MDGPIGRFRWWVCGLLFAATTLNYIDRQVLGVLAPDLGRIIGWNEVQYGYIVAAFQAAYAIGLISAGALVDRFGAAWLILWLRTYRPVGLQQAESAGRLRAAELLRHRQTWAFIAGKVIADPIWWIFLFWLPKFLNQEYGLSLLKLGPPLIVIYLMADAGSIGGGWIAGYFLRRGWSVNRARKTTMLLCALAVTPVVLSFQAHSLWLAVGLIGLATAAHQGWSVNQFTLPSDLFPPRAVASVVGIGGFAGAVSGLCASTLTGFLLQATGSYIPIFIVAATAYLVALAVIQTLVPRMEPAMLRGQI